MAQLVTGVSTVLAKISGRKKLSAVCSSSDGLSERSIFPTTVSVEVMESPFFKDLSAISLRTLPMFTHLPILQKVA